LTPTERDRVGVDYAGVEDKLAILISVMLSKL
jgi:hypothetical protein